MSAIRKFDRQTISREQNLMMLSSLGGREGGRSQARVKLFVGSSVSGSCCRKAWQGDVETSSLVFIDDRIWRADGARLLVLKSCMAKTLSHKKDRWRKYDYIFLLGLLFTGLWNGVGEWCHRRRELWPTPFSHSGGKVSGRGNMVMASWNLPSSTLDH